MDLTYDLFEQFPDGSVFWRAFVPGLENAQARLQELAGRSPNDHFAMYLPSKEIVGRVNAPKDLARRLPTACHRAVYKPYVSSQLAAKLQNEHFHYPELTREQLAAVLARAEETINSEIAAMLDDALKARAESILSEDAIYLASSQPPERPALAEVARGPA